MGETRALAQACPFALGTAGVALEELPSEALDEPVPRTVPAVRPVSIARTPTTRPAPMPA